MSTNHGGWAFPVPNDANMNGEEGMTLRDYFAAKALSGYIARGGAYEEDKTAERCFALADAMIAAREGGAV